MLQYETFSLDLHDLLSKLHWSQTDLHICYGIPRPTISKWLSKKASPPEWIAKLLIADLEYKLKSKNEDKRNKSQGYSNRF